MNRAPCPHQGLSGRTHYVHAGTCNRLSKGLCRPGQQARRTTVPVQVFLSLTELQHDRQAHRTVYDFPQWQKHRSPYRLFDRLMSIRSSVILKSVLPTVAWVTSVSMLLVAVAQLAPQKFAAWIPNAACKAFIAQTSVAMSMLLVFRTNAAYGRWDEARRLWGVLVNRSRDLARMTTALFPASATEARAAMTRWLVAFPRLLRIFLQPEVTLDNSDLTDYLSPAELKMLRASTNPQAKAIHVMSELIHRTVRNPVQQMQLSQNLTQYHDVLGGCERILRTPIPVSYTRHTARFLFCWLTLLPFTLPAVPWQVPAVAGITMILAAVEEIGVQCEEPFGILPLDKITERITTDILETVESEEELWSVLQEGAEQLQRSQTMQHAESNGNGVPQDGVHTHMSGDGTGVLPVPAHATSSKQPVSAYYGEELDQEQDRFFHPTTS